MSIIEAVVSKNKPTIDTLDSLIEFGIPFAITDEGDLDGDVSDPFIADVEVHVNDIDVLDRNGRSWAAPYGWDTLRGYSGQHGYAEAIMHPSEQLAGHLARDILSTPGYYCLVQVSTDCRNFEDLATRHEFFEVAEYGVQCDHDPAGWAVLYRPVIN